jgi:hypothetical protein
VRKATTRLDGRRLTDAWSSRDGKRRALQYDGQVDIRLIFDDPDGSVTRSFDNPRKAKFMWDSFKDGTIGVLSIRKNTTDRSRLEGNNG